MFLHLSLAEAGNQALFEDQVGCTMPGATWQPAHPVQEGGTFAASRAVYYREMVARYSYHLGLVWDLGQGSGGSINAGPGKAATDAQRLAFAGHIQALDPYSRPVTVNIEPQPYTPLLGSGSVLGPSLAEQDLSNVYPGEKPRSSYSTD